VSIAFLCVSLGNEVVAVARDRRSTKHNVLKGSFCFDVLYHRCLNESRIRVLVVFVVLGGPLVMVMKVVTAFWICWSFMSWQIIKKSGFLYQRGRQIQQTFSLEYFILLHYLGCQFCRL